MKKWIAMLLVLVMILSLCACAAADSDATEKEPASAGTNDNGGNDSGNNNNSNNGDNNNQNTNPQKKVETFILKELSVVDYEYESGNKMTFEYDAQGNLIAMNTPTTQTTFDLHISRPLVELIPARQKRTVSTYDAAGRLLSRYEYDEEDGDCEGYTYTYDEKGNLLTVEEYEDYTLDDGTRYTYDANGNMLTMTQYDENGDKYWNTYTYGANGNMLTEVHCDETGERSRNTYTYDENGKLTKNVYCYSIDFVDRVENYEEVYEYSYTYNNGKLVETKAFENGVLTNHITLNENGDVLTDARYSAANGKETSRNENTYDESGRLVRVFMTDEYLPNDITVTYSYDAAGNMSERITDFGGKYQYKDTFTYDADGNLVKVEGYKGEELRFEATLTYEMVQVSEAVAENAADILDYIDLIGESEPSDPDDNNYY